MIAVCANLSGSCGNASALVALVQCAASESAPGANVAPCLDQTEQRTDSKRGEG
jgi:hypothetical protein